MTPGDELLFLALGGSGEIGMNVNLYGCRGKWLMADLGLTFADTQYLYDGQHEANARLIAAAPELLQALRRALVSMEGELSNLLSSVCLLDDNLRPIRETCEDCEEVERLEADIASARESIAKATGGPVRD